MLIVIDLIQIDRDRTRPEDLIGSLDLRVVGPKGLWSEGSLVRRVVCSKGRWSEGSLVRRIIGLRGHWAESTFMLGMYCNQRHSISRCRDGIKHIFCVKNGRYVCLLSEG